MAVTYVLADQRPQLTSDTRAHSWHTTTGLLAAASGVALLAVSLAATGRLQTLDEARDTRADRAAVNLNHLASASQIEVALVAAVKDSAERQLVARELFRVVSEHRNTVGPLPNVGFLARASVSAAALDAVPHARSLSERLAAARQSASAAGRPEPDAVALLTPAELAAAKPHLSVRTREDFRTAVIAWTVLYVIAFHLVTIAWRAGRIDGDYLLLAAVHVLTAIGLAVLVGRSDPVRDTLLFVRYAQTTIVGLAVLAAASLVPFRVVRFLELSYVPLVSALVLSAALVLFGTGPGASRARVNLGPVQPVEAIRLLLAFFLAGYFARRWELLRGLRGTAVRSVRIPRWLNLPPAEYVLPVALGVAAALLLFFLQKDLGPALVVCCVFLAVYAIARARVGMAITGFSLLVAGFYAGYRLGISGALAARVEMWQSPWDNLVGGGNQVAHAIWALATGGIFGTGLGLGDTRYLPAGHTDLVLAAVGEELGLAGVLLVTFLFSVIGWRGFHVARRASSDYAFFLATALTLLLLLPVLIMAMGITGLTPLTGVVTPFLSYGGSAMVANLAAIGLLVAIEQDPRASDTAAPFGRSLRWLGISLALPTLVLLGTVLNVQIVNADEFVARPHLAVQADGGRRFEYNPRLLDVARAMPRGTIFDRDGLVLATDDPQVVEHAREAYARLGVSLGRVCPSPDERCYPLGGRAFHLLGDAGTRTNWSAPNTSYAERDAEDTLRGFDDRAAVVETRTGNGTLVAAVRRDYREIVPVLRHRYEPNHPAMTAARERQRDLTLTIDARLQFRVAAIVRAHAERTSGRAAAVVLDPDTGDLLASASYPWPNENDTRQAGMLGTSPDADPFLDRARYGLYPPGSTFKLVTAAAALREDPSLQRTHFTCTALPGGRAGARIAGWARPVRDDVKDTHPHGSIDLHQAFVRSCNAYFAQLGARVGARALVDTASELGIALTPAADVGRRVRETLPQAAYGQADVLATPLRMARLAAAVAADGVLRETRWRKPRSGDSGRVQFLDPTAARLLATYMRDAVVEGTGRVLKSNAHRLAGKTGTAELSGKPSHSWFIGFAPHGPASRRIAFAVIVEHAGYGALSAAPAAGEIVNAAAAAGLIE